MAKKYIVDLNKDEKAEADSLSICFRLTTAVHIDTSAPSERSSMRPLGVYRWLAGTVWK